VSKQAYPSSLAKIYHQYIPRGVTNNPVAEKAALDSW
jgi:hypothetical protein